MYLDEVVSAQKRGDARGIVSICSAHPAVLETAMRHAKGSAAPLLVESTCNQVNQFGGYTGMTPADFVASLRGMAERLNFPQENLILGGDHLGPNVWKDEPAAHAMAKAKALVRDYIRAGYVKIHQDASMKLGDDPAGPLPVEVIAARAAELAQVAEAAFAAGGGTVPPRYVSGSEVPIPGGAQGEEDELRVTALPDLAETLRKSEQAFRSLGLESAWERVIAVVVQPGVEFGDSSIHEYNREAAAGLSRFIEGQPMVFEAHSTDYQTRRALRQMVEDHFAVLKVGPALTFAYREAVFALAMMEAALLPAAERSGVVEALDLAMMENPVHWQRYYRGDAAAQAFARRYSFSDRVRYYWGVPAVRESLARLMRNLKRVPLPLPLVSQFFPRGYRKIREGEMPLTAEALLHSRIEAVLEDYRFAAGG
jgi:D-tagatose-1,6-bisphosphate aldolase subunit GatZ/KbaZ